MTDDDLLKAGSNEIELVDFRILKKTKDGILIVKIKLIW